MGFQIRKLVMNEHLFMTLHIDHGVEFHNIWENNY